MHSEVPAPNMVYILPVFSPESPDILCCPTLPPTFPQFPFLFPQLTSSAAVDVSYQQDFPIFLPVESTSLLATDARRYISSRYPPIPLLHQFLAHPSSPVLLSAHPSFLPVQSTDSPMLPPEYTQRVPVHSFAGCVPAQSASDIPFVSAQPSVPVPSNFLFAT